MKYDQIIIYENKVIKKSDFYLILTLKQIQLIPLDISKIILTDDFYNELYDGMQTSDI